MQTVVNKNIFKSLIYRKLDYILYPAGFDILNSVFFTGMR